MKLHTKQLTLAALTAAAYAVLSYFGSIFGITYGPIQCRFSEALCVLPFFLPETAWGLGVGCLIANLLSPYGVLDIVVGSAATLLAALLRSLHSGVPFDIMPQMNALILSVLAALAIISWSVFLYRPRKARSLVLQLLPWCFLFIRMAVPLTQLPRP